MPEELGALRHGDYAWHLGNCLENCHRMFVICSPNRLVFCLLARGTNRRDSGNRLSNRAGRCDAIKRFEPLRNSHRN